MRCVEIIAPRTALPIHYNDFWVFQSGLEDFQHAAAASVGNTEFHYVSHGDKYRFRPVQQ